MSIDLKMYLAHKGMFEGDENTWFCTDALNFERDPKLFSLLVDTGESEKDEPLIETEPVDQDEVLTMVKGIDGEDLNIDYAVQCQAMEFTKIPNEFCAGKKNLAIINFLKSIEPETTILIFMC